AFITNESPFRYLDAYNASLFLSRNARDVESAIRAGYAAGTVLPSALNDDPEDDSLRVAFDFDGVLADGSGEQIYKGEGLAGFHKVEAERAEIPYSPGPLADLLRKLFRLREIEFERQLQESAYRRRLSISIVTARNAPAHERVVSTLRKWNITTDQTFFLGGMNKGRILSVLRPHIFFDDQIHPHLDAARDFTPSVHIPFPSNEKENPA
ncbi:MAG: 5'-nucleotidase, partial [Lentisphaeria bacterium]|nr:5'-nucleotidase [Lentisphaeria bacterium]